MYLSMPVKARVAPTLVPPSDLAWHNHLKIAEFALRSGNDLLADRMFRAALVETGRNSWHYTCVGEALKEMADLYLPQERSTRAEQLYKRAIASYEYVLGMRHEGLSTLLVNLAEIYLADGKQKSALRLLNRANFILEKAGAYDCQLRRNCLEKTIEVLIDLGKQEELLVVSLKLAQMIYQTNCIEESTLTNG